MLHHVLATYRFGVSVAALHAAAVTTVGGEFLAGETDAMGIDFTYHTDRSKQLYISDLTTPANNYNGDAQPKLTYTSPSLKLCRQSDGVWRYGSHNLYLNSAAPANQTVTVVSGGTYDIVVTGTVSITWSGAYVGTTTAGTTSITAASTSLTGGSTSGTGTVAVYRTPNVGTYLATAGAAKYDLPYEWNAALASQGILIEEQRANIVIRSQEIDNAVYVKDGGTATAANNTTAPDGTTTADKFTCGAGSGVGWYVSGLSATGPQTWSIFAKKSTHRYFRLTLALAAGTSWVTAIFDLDGGGSTATQTGTFGGWAIGATTQIDAGNGWFRCSATLTTAGLCFPIYGMVPAATGNTLDNAYGGVTWTPAGTEAQWLWGMQLETGAFATSPIHTLAVSVTRAADNISLPTSVTPIGTTPTVGTLVLSFYRPIAIGSQIMLAVDDGEFSGFNNCFDYRVNDMIIQNGGVGQAAFSATPAAATVEKWAMAWGVNTANAAVNGTLAGADDTTVSAPTVSRIGLTKGAIAPLLSGYHRQLTYLKRRATNGELQSRTT